MIVLYTVWTLILELNVSPKLVLQSFVFGNTIVANAWYLQSTFVLYVFYWLVFTFSKSQKMRIFFLGIYIVAYGCFCYMIHLGMWWYQTIPSVLLGMVYCYKKDKFDLILAKHPYILCLFFSASFIATLLITKKNTLFNMAYPLVFVCIIITISYILCNTPIINNAFLAWCGKYSLEIYVSHGLFLKFISLKIINNLFISIPVVFIGTVVTSLFLRKLYTLIVDFFTVKSTVSK